MTDALKDLNDNRLTKFEIALLLAKITEDAITDSVQCPSLHPLSLSFPPLCRPPAVSPVFIVSR